MNVVWYVQVNGVGWPSGVLGCVLRHLQAENSRSDALGSRI